MSDMPQLPLGRGPTSEQVEELEEEKEEEWKGWSTGYRGWKLKFEKGEPRLGSVALGGHWEPGEEGEVLSDWEEGKDEPFETTSKGLYSLKTLEDVKSRYPKEDVYGAIIPYGKTFHGSLGYRSEKAKVRAIFKGVVPCYICGKPAKYFLRNDEKFSLDEKCLKRLEKLIKSKKYTEEDIDTVLHRLAQIYDAVLTEYEE